MNNPVKHRKHKTQVDDVPPNPDVVNVLSELGKAFINLFSKKGHSGTGLKQKDLETFWKTLEKIVNLPAEATTEESSIKLQEYTCQLNRNLKMLRMEAPPLGFDDLSVFGSLTDLTLTSNTTIKEIKDKRGMPNVLCLRLDGVRLDETRKIKIRGFPKLMKLVICNMEQVTEIEIDCDVSRKIATLKLYKLPGLKKVGFSSIPLLEWNNGMVTTTTLSLGGTMFLREFDSFPVNIMPGLMIYHYPNENQCNKYIMREPIPNSTR